MTETETISDVLSALFILFVGYVIVREVGGIPRGSVLGLAWEFVQFAGVVIFVLALVGLLVQALD